MKSLVGYRKWSMAVLFLATAIIMRVTGYIPDTGWLEAVKDAMVAFFAGNLTEHIVTIVKAKIEEKKAELKWD